jgi:hypothetical protein
MPIVVMTIGKVKPEGAKGHYYKQVSLILTRQIESNESE